MRAFGRDHSHRGEELRLSRLQGPRRTRLRDQRAEEVAPGLVRARRSARRSLWVGAALLCRLSWVMLNFAMPEFSEVGRAALVTFSTSWRLIHRLVLSWRVTKRHSNRSKREGNTLVWVVWALMTVMLVCLVLWAATGAVALLFAAVLAGLGVLYVALLTNL